MYKNVAQRYYHGLACSKNSDMYGEKEVQMPPTVSVLSCNCHAKPQGIKNCEEAQEKVAKFLTWNKLGELDRIQN